MQGHLFYLSSFCNLQVPSPLLNFVQGSGGRAYARDTMPCSLVWEGEIDENEFDNNSLIANGALTSKAVIPIHGLLSLDSILKEIITELLLPEARGFEASR